MINIQKLRPVLSRSIILRPICSMKNVRISASSIQPTPSSLLTNPPNIRQFCCTSARLSNDDELPKKILVEQNFKVPSFGGIFGFKGPVNVKVGGNNFQNFDQILKEKMSSLLGGISLYLPNC